MSLRNKLSIKSFLSNLMTHHCYQTHNWVPGICYAFALTEPYMTYCYQAKPLICHYTELCSKNKNIIPPDIFNLHQCFTGQLLTLYCPLFRLVDSNFTWFIHLWPLLCLIKLLLYANSAVWFTCCVLVKSPLMHCFLPSLACTNSHVIS